MIRLTGKEDCCGCSACVERCPKQCISFSEDKEGFFYPSVDVGSCIDCGVCESVCPFAHPAGTRLPLKVLAAKNIDETVRLASSSGGIFTYLATQIINQRGVVFGAQFNDEWLVDIGYSETIDGLSGFRGSKYLQANVGDSFTICEDFLKSGRKVLFSGTPCQIAGLKKFLREDYGNLITVDFVCHGVPSPKVWKLYLHEIEETLKEHRRLSDIKFSSVINNDGKFSIVSPFSCNDYMEAFLKNLILRPSCYHCKVRECRSESDITIGDYWGIQNVSPEIDDNKGTSLILIHTSKGLGLVNCADISSVETTFNEAVTSNPSVISSPTTKKIRELFFRELDASTSVIKLIRKNVRKLVPLPKRFHTFAHLVKSGLKHNKKKVMVAHFPDTAVPKGISFRSKANGWKEYEMKIDF